MPWDMHRLTLREWKMIVAAGEKPADDAGPSRFGEPPDGWESWGDE